MSGGKGEKRDYESNYDTTNDVSMTYADAVGDDVWNEVVSKYNKKMKSKANESMELLGAKDSTNKDIFVPSLDYSRCKKPQQLEHMVKSYCRRRGVEVLYAKAFKTKSDPMRANCRIAVNIGDVKCVLVDDFWPQRAYARYWYTHPHQQNENEILSDDGGLSD